MRTTVLNSRTGNIGIAAICALSLLAMGCATPNHVGPISRMPQCYVNGMKGVWLSLDAGRNYRCISQTAFQNWRKLNGL